MRDDEIRRRLTDANPWWRASTGGDPTAWTSSHRLFTDRAVHDLGFRSQILDDVATGPVTDLLTILAGPRRVGKSVALLDAAATLCAREDIDSRQIVHLPCDGMAARDLRRAFTLGRDLTRSVDHDAVQRRVWLLDEITGVAGWTTAVKEARDGTALGDDTVVATGSRWVANEDVTGNLLAGRAGTQPGRRVRQLLPMSFRDYVAATRPSLLLPSVVHPSHMQTPEVDRALATVEFDIDEYDRAWQAYLTCGGFPRAAAEYERDGVVSEPYMRDLAAWLRSDVDPDEPPESVPLLLHELSCRSTSPLNVTKVAQELGRTTRIFEVRLTRLVNSFAALHCPKRSDVGSRIAGAASKVYLTDPVLAWLPSRLRNGLAAPDMTALTEAAIGVHLARAIEAQEEGRWVTGDTIGYARTDSDNEVDFAPVSLPTTSGAATTTPLESKWVDSHWRSEARVIEGKYARGIVATKSILATGHKTWAVPAPLVALLLA